MAYILQEYTQKCPEENFKQPLVARFAREFEDNKSPKRFVFLWFRNVISQVFHGTLNMENVEYQ